MEKTKKELPVMEDIYLLEVDYCSNGKVMIVGWSDNFPDGCMSYVVSKEEVPTKEEFEKAYPNAEIRIS